MSYLGMSNHSTWQTILYLTLTNKNIYKKYMSCKNIAQVKELVKKHKDKIIIDIKEGGSINYRELYLMTKENGN